jgi:membrane protease YdiL (CAAX protease family)
MQLRKLYLPRLVLLAGTLQAAQIGFAALITHKLDTTISGLFSKPVAVLLPLLVPAILTAFAVYWLGVRLLEQRPVRELALAPALTNLSIGVGSGVLLFASVFGAIAAEGSVTYEGYAGFGKLQTAALTFTAGIVFEELIFRGVIFRIAEESLGTASALVLSALLFGASHLGNNGVTVIGALALFAGGITLSLTYCLSKNLWLPIGAHFGWNFTMGALFGTAVSGHEAQGVFRFGLSGPQWMTGGIFGPESSIYALLFLVLLAIVLGRFAWRSNNWASSRFRMRQT